MSRSGTSPDTRLLRSVGARLGRELLPVVCTMLLLLFALGCTESLAGSAGGALGPKMTRERLGVIFGRVVSAPGVRMRHESAPQGVLKAQVIALNPSSKAPVASATTGADGTYRMSVAAGTYLVEWGDTRQYATVKPGQQVEVNFAVPNP